jgi:hypothetical protein
VYIVTENARWNSVDFEDTTTAPLTVEVAGGACNRELGESTLKLILLECAGIGGNPFERAISLGSGFRQTYNVPAHFTLVQLSEVKNRPQVTDYLDRVKLRTQPAGLSDGLASVVRFEFHPPPTLSIALVGATQTECDAAPVIVSAGTSTTVKFAIVEQFSDVPNPVPACDIYDADNITVINNAARDTHPGDASNFCIGGCDLPVQHIVAENGERSGAFAELAFVTGSPQENPELASEDWPHTRQLRASAATPGQPVEEATIYVLIRGPKAISDDFSVPFPQHVPLAVVRDPPGGLSSSFNVHVDATLRTVVHTNHDERNSRPLTLGALIRNPLKLAEDLGNPETYLNNFHIGYSANYEIETSACVGVGVSACDEQVLGFEFDHEGGMERETLDFDDSPDKNFAVGAQLHLQSTFSTPDDAGLAGRLSDMYLLPIMNIVFSKSVFIDWDHIKCEATSTDIVTWSLKGDKNKNLLAWRSEHDIRGVIIPELEDLIQYEASKDTAADLTKLEELRNSLSGWTDLLAKSNATYMAAAAGKLDVYPGLFTTTDVASSTDEPLEGFSFSGGGATIEIEQTTTAEKDSSALKGRSQSQTSDGTFSLGATVGRVQRREICFLRLLA